ncbi:RiPP maturation radical SAM C-methyltransferase [Pyxidicoccus sp. MSG2]|uniref:RiPP maturation radical SAM C-methyltransferase n=1 Tax=Pyxidicoccus sp. MSG2 TaxID=2996790 RepID=UPI002270F7C6|nr:RiPP maturation radical SAM C-methyltransferase [Pyxidicoccus sp. MSG2]MCY1014464.1 RiPP maturation radical SAM C-methyltransferase [Pyxidicoccus sp. MSG2]
MNIESLNALLPGGDALIIVPPFGSVFRPSLGAHQLQACGRERGFRVSILYANILLAEELGREPYRQLCETPPMTMMGERFFARAAHGLPPLGLRADRPFERRHLFGGPDIHETSLSLRAVPYEASGFNAYALPDLRVDTDELSQLEERAGPWADRVAELVAQLDYPVVGCTSTFEQTNAGLALLGRIKRLRSELVTLMGGANCAGEMAEGIASIGSYVDHVFSGEADAAFPDFLQALMTGARPRERIIKGEPCRNLEALPTPDFDDYFAQRERILPFADGRTDTALPYESSRGCWWGQKHHCTFCGLNAEGMTSRQKSPERVLRDLRSLATRYGTQRFSMADNIMPWSYRKTLIARLEEEPTPLRLFYEQKANLSLPDVRALKRAHLVGIQPGIEALSSALLKRMDKGVLARQNLMLLRYTRAVGLRTEWNLLWGFPGDEPEAYEETLALMPLLHHLQPPSELNHISIDRFSPYYDRSLSYGLSNMRPHPVYRCVLPAHTDFEKVAYRFVADYQSGSYRCLPTIGEIARQLEQWRARWALDVREPPSLRIISLGEDYIVRDTRGLPGTEEVQVIDRTQAISALGAGPWIEQDPAAWAVERKLGVVMDGWYVPLLIANPELLTELETQGQAARARMRPTSSVVREHVAL